MEVFCCQLLGDSRYMGKSIEEEVLLKNLRCDYFVASLIFSNSFIRFKTASD
jgi:hypothetical protein